MSRQGVLAVLGNLPHDSAIPLDHFLRLSYGNVNTTALLVAQNAWFERS